MRKTISSGVPRLPSPAVCDAVAWTSGGSHDESATGSQGVPVVLPVREGSPGGSYGTVAEGHPLCPAVFPTGVRLADGTEVHDERTDELSYGDGSVLAGLLPRSGSRSCA